MVASGLLLHSLLFFCRSDILEFSFFYVEILTLVTWTDCLTLNKPGLIDNFDCNSLAAWHQILILISFAKNLRNSLMCGYALLF
ncbi:hypothetical protein RIR_jg30455.t1 [Rhizophagus irregularis DAOM 181602=DAOM 197198]|nr:hypothetical protein RIR_jg30455.t1 [Rhizophagus irregularis DAOM 181602=DAOM 197198]